ncbi:MAG: mechanosensitive ion channel family protein [Methanosarcinales archaeon]|nr:mechanosensitive ion channel family protein [Methanosarcinales archaeon]
MVFESLFADNINVFIERIGYVIIIIFTASFTAKTIATIISRIGKKSGLPANVTRWINKIITYFIGFIGLVLILDVFHLNINTFLASFGIVGLIIGLSSQAIISNFIAGIPVMLEKPFYRGDIIDISGVQGTVEDISIRSTRIKTMDGKVITVPNSTLTSNSVINYSKAGRIQVRIPISFPPEADLEKIKQIMIAAAKDIEGIRPYHIEVLSTGMTLSGLSKNIIVEYRFWIDRFIEKDRISSQVLSRIKDDFKNEQIIMTSV